MERSLTEMVRLPLAGVTVTVLVGFAAAAGPVRAAPTSTTAAAVIGPVSQAYQWQLMAAGAALSRSTNPQVLSIARQVRDYAPRLRGQIEQLATRTGAQLPTWPSERQQHCQAVLDRRTGLD